MPYLSQINDTDYSKSNLISNNMKLFQTTFIVTISIISSAQSLSYLSLFGGRSLHDFFRLADSDDNGEIDRDESKMAASKIGPDWFEENEIENIFNKIDLNGNGVIDFDEFKEESPKVLKANLRKLAKKKGGCMGWFI